MTLVPIHDVTGSVNCISLVRTPYNNNMMFACVSQIPGIKSNVFLVKNRQRSQNVCYNVIAEFNNYLTSNKEVRPQMS